MPSNKDLEATAEALAKELGLDELNPESLNNKQLTDLVADLKAKKRDLELDTDADIDPDVDEEAALEAGQKAYDESLAKTKAKFDKNLKRMPFEVAKGKALTSKRGILAEGDEIKAEDLAGGQEAIDAFVKTGHIVKN